MPAGNWDQRYQTRKKITCLTGDVQVSGTGYPSRMPQHKSSLERSANSYKEKDTNKSFNKLKFGFQDNERIINTCIYK